MRIQSFIWNRDDMVFVPDSTRIGFNPRSTFEELVVPLSAGCPPRSGKKSLARFSARALKRSQVIGSSAV